MTKGYHQIDGVDYSKIFSPVIKPSTIYIVLTVTLDIKNGIFAIRYKKCILHDFLNECVFMEQPPTLIHKDFSNHICKLHLALYGLK